MDLARIDFGLALGQLHGIGVGVGSGALFGPVLGIEMKRVFRNVSIHRPGYSKYVWMKCLSSAWSFSSSQGRSGFWAWTWRKWPWSESWI